MLTVFAVRGAKAWAIITILILAVVGLGWWLAARASSLRTTLAQANASTSFRIARNGWVAGFLDPLAVLGIWKSDSSLNDSGWKNPQFDALLQEAGVTGDPSLRFAKLRQAEEILVQDAPLLPIYSYTRVYLLDPAVTGWHANIEDQHFVQFLDLQPGIPLR
ncbi:MAG: hypothetical protein WB696_31070 [Chthoniobacterales bacterium]